MSDEPGSEACGCDGSVFGAATLPGIRAGGELWLAPRVYAAVWGPTPACAELVARIPSPPSAATAEIVTEAASTAMRP